MLGIKKEFNILVLDIRKRMEFLSAKYGKDEDGLLVTLITFLYGMQIMLHADILSQYRVYQIVLGSNFLNHITIGFLFVVAAVCKGIGVLTHIASIRRFAITALTVVWSFYFVSFAISPPPNTVWIMSLGMVILCFRIARNN